MASEKTVFPSISLDFLGIHIDTILLQFQLPEAKVEKAKLSIILLLHQKKVSLKEFQSLLGLLAFASCIMPVGRIFLRRLSLATSGLKSPFSHISLTLDLKDDLLIW